jgi:glycosyltransferase involved in cell wall biosynthesis
MHREMMEEKKGVLIVTPGLNGLGGVANYYKTILPLLEGCEFSIDFLETGSAKGKGNFFHPITDQFNFFKRLREKQPMLIHTNPSLDSKSFIRDGLLVYQTVRRNIPVVVFFHGWDMAFARRVEKHFLGFFKATFGKANAFIVLAWEFKEKLCSWKVSAPIFTETTTVDATLLEGFDIEKKMADILDKKFFRILYLARFEQAKGIFETVDAVKLLSERGVPVSLSIAGDGPAKQELKHYIEKHQFLPGKVVFLGYVKGHEKAFVFASHDIYCFPTYYREGLPISVLEALAFGMPVVTCAVGGLADIFRDGEMGALVPTRNPEAIANIIEQMISDREAMARIVKNNHAYAKENFLAPKVAARLLDIYRETIWANGNDR